MGFDVPVGKITAKQTEILKEVRKRMPSTSDIAKADETEMREFKKSMEDLISHMKNEQSQTDDLFEYPLRKLLGLDKELKRIRGSLKVETAKRFS